MPMQPLLFTYWLLRVPVFLFTFRFQTQSVRLHSLTYHSLFSTYVNSRTPSFAISHQVLPTQPYPGKQKIFLGVTSILSMRLCSYT